MPERPDLRRIATDIREALATYPREALVDILTYVFQAYIVEGAPTVHAPPVDRLSDLEGLSFADVMQALQLRLDLPELGLFDVQAGRVSVRVGGELHPLVLGADARRAATAPLPAAPAVQAAVSAPAATVARPPAPAEAPRPARGLSVNPGSGGARSTTQPAAPPPPAAGSPRAPAP